MRTRLERIALKVRQNVARITDFLVTSLSAVKYIQAVATERHENERLEDLNQGYRKDLLRQQMTGYVATGVPGLMLSIATTGVFLAGSQMVISGSLSLGALVAFTTYLARATGPVQSFLGLYPAYQRTKVSLARVMEIAAEPVGVPRGGPGLALPPGGTGEIKLDGVFFRYEEDADWILRDATLTLPGGQKTGVLGLSGVGKSTLIDLLHRHYDPHKGTIRLDGIDLKDLNLADMRRKIAVVSQDPVLFRGSFRDNIRYGTDHATDVQVKDAAKAAQLHDHINALPQGYDSDVGVDGRTLSAGQKQRLSIARAVLADPLILILDEATAALDIETEEKLMARIDALFSERTRIIISHRASAFRDADLILKMSNGALLPQYKAPDQKT